MAFERFVHLPPPVFSTVELWRTIALSRRGLRALCSPASTRILHSSTVENYRPLLPWSSSAMFTYLHPHSPQLKRLRALCSPTSIPYSPQFNCGELLPSLAVAFERFVRLPPPVFSTVELWRTIASSRRRLQAPRSPTSARSSPLSPSPSSFAFAYLRPCPSKLTCGELSPLLAATFEPCARLPPSMFSIVELW